MTRGELHYRAMHRNGRDGVLIEWRRVTFFMWEQVLEDNENVVINIEPLPEMHSARLQPSE